KGAVVHRGSPAAASPARAPRSSVEANDHGLADAFHKSVVVVSYQPMIAGLGSRLCLSPGIAFERLQPVADTSLTDANLTWRWAASLQLQIIRNTNYKRVGALGGEWAQIATDS